MKILVIRFGSLGDLLLTLPAVRDLSAGSNGELHFLLLEEYHELLAPLPELTRLWTLPRGAGLGELREIAAKLSDQRFDLVLDLHDNLRSRLLRSLLRGRPRWVKTEREDLRRRLMLSRRWLPGALRTRRALDPVRERQRAAVARALGRGYRAAPARPYPIADELRAAVDAELTALGISAEDRPIGIAPGAAWPEKVWPRHGDLLERLRGKAPLLLFGGPDEEDLCRELAGGTAVSFAGARPLPRVAAALARCRLLVTGDTGLGHLAEAVGRPVLALFGPTVPAFGFAPSGKESHVLERDLPCRPCSLHGEKACRYGHHDCLEGIDVSTVMETLVQMAPGLR